MRAGEGSPSSPYALLPQRLAFAVSIIVASCTLFAVGVFKARVVGLRQFTSGAQTLAFGAIAIALGYGIGTLLPHLVGIQPQSR